MTVLRQRMTEDMQERNLSTRTQASYLQQVSLFARHFAKSPDVLAPEHIRTYQIYLTNEKKLAAGSIHIAVAATRFLYKITLKREWSFADVLPLPKILSLMLGAGITRLHSFDTISLRDNSFLPP
jgi:integrase/recombinase XerD